MDFLNNWIDFYEIYESFCCTKHLSEFNFNSRFVVLELVAASGGQQCKIRKMGNCLQIFLWSTFALFWGKWIFFGQCT